MTVGPSQPKSRFGVMLYPDENLPVLLDRIRWLEELGFDQVFLPDHSGDLRDRRRQWYDSWAVLAAAAVSTRRIRLGMLVANQILRPPSQRPDKPSRSTTPPTAASS